MQEVSIARKGEYFQALFDLLVANPDGVAAREAVAAVEQKLTLAPYETELFPSGTSRFRKNFSFGTIDMVKAGWLVKHKGIWTISEAGKLAHQTLKEPAALYGTSLTLYRKWRQAQPDASTNGTLPDADPTEAETSEQSIQVTYEQAEAQAWSEIEAFLRNMAPFDFQELVAALLRGMGYHVDWIAPPGRDGGIDILAYADPLGTRPPRIKVQVKRWGANIDVKGVREFVGVLGADDLGLFVTTSGFTKDAKDEARAQQTRKVTLIDLERFFDLWVEHYPKLDDAARRRFPLQPIYFLAPAN